ncbi:SpoIIE family protein phosphatase [Streptomyces sp. NPDC001009]
MTLAREVAESPSGELNHALLEALFTISPVGLYLLDPEMRILRFNPAAEGMENTPVESAAGKRPTEVWPGASVEAMERVMEQVLATGRPAIGVEKRMCPPGDPDHEHVYAASVFPLTNEDGRVLGIADATVDVTDRELGQERLRVLALAGTRIGATLDVLDNAEALAEVAVPGLADSVSVDVLEPVLTGDDLESGPVAPDVLLRRAVVRTRSGGHGTTMAGQKDPHPPMVAAEVLTDLEPRIVDPQSVLGRHVLANLPADGEPVHSLMLVPLVAQARALGFTALCRWGGSRRFERDDLTLAGELALRTAACLDNARRFLRERNSVLALQHAVRESGFPPRHTLEVAHEYVQAGTGGDWVDVIPLSGARVALVAGRAYGSGIQAAAAAGRLRAAVHTLSDLDMEPDELVARLDDLTPRLFGRAGQEHAEPSRREDLPPGRDEARATCLYIAYDPVAQCCSCASAGHPWPVIVGPDGVEAPVEQSVGPPLGGSGAPYENVDLPLPENSSLALYTPGLYQDRPERRVRERVAALVAGFPGPVREACAIVTKAVLPASPREDAVVQIARVHALDPAWVASLDLSCEPSVVSEARSWVNRQLQAWGLDEAAFTTELIASELVTNAIRYAKPPVSLRLIRGDVLTCEVSDGSSTSPRLRHARATDEGGRGLLLAAGFSERWGARYTGDGKTIWVEQSLDPVA